MTWKCRIGVDVGGTFTDLVVVDERGALLCLEKAPSRPGHPERGVLDALGRAARTLEVDLAGLLGRCSRFIHGTTIATNALLTRRGAKVGMLVTEGFRDALCFRRGFRENVWDHRAAYPPILAPRYLRPAVRERIDWMGNEVVPIDERGVARAAEVFREEGVDSIAVCLFNAYLNGAHEERATAILEEKLPEIPIFLSSRRYRGVNPNSFVSVWAACSIFSNSVMLSLQKSSYQRIKLSALQLLR